MQWRALLIVSLLLVACGTPRFKFGGITPDDAVTLAEKELARRHLPLPRNYSVAAEKSAILYSTGAGISVYGVTFSKRMKGHPHTLYYVSVNKNSGGIEALFDERDVWPEKAHKRK